MSYVKYAKSFKNIKSLKFAMILLVLSSFLSVHYLTFDVYGTLLNMDTISETISKIAEENHYDPKEAASMYSITEDEIMYGEDFMTLDKVINKTLFWTDIYLNQNFYQANYDKVIQAYKNLQPFPDVIPSLQTLKSRGYTLVMMSNSMDMIMDENKKALGDLFDKSYLAEQIKAYKPRIEFFEYVHKDLNFDSVNHTHIANGYWWDMEPATKMKWPHKIWVNRRSMRGSPEFDPQIEVLNLEEALQYLPPIDQDL